MLRSLLVFIFSSFACTGCASPSPSTNHVSTLSPTATANSSTAPKALSQAERNASPAGQKILRTGRIMALQKKEIIRGSCWNYINTVYQRSGYSQQKRHYVLKGKKNKGPYAKTNQIKPGDWLYYINHSYHGVEHSGIFVRWADKSKRIGVILSYGGEARKKPGRYRNYDLRHVYTIIRAKE